MKETSYQKAVKKKNKYRQMLIKISDWMLDDPSKINTLSIYKFIRKGLDDEKDE